MCAYLQLEAARTGNTQDSKELHEKIVEAQARIDVRINLYVECVLYIVSVLVVTGERDT